MLAAAVMAQVDRLLMLNTRDFTQKVAQQSGLMIQTPGQFVEDVGTLIPIDL